MRGSCHTRAVGIACAGEPAAGIAGLRAEQPRARAGMLAPALGLAVVAAVAAVLIMMSSHSLAGLRPLSGDAGHSAGTARLAPIQTHALAAVHGRQLPALAALSASIGASDARYWALRRNSTLVARGAGIQSAFSAGGVRMTVARGTLSMSLTSLGRGGRSVRVLRAAPQARGAQVTYGRGPISESYRNGPFGLEQAFAVRSAPLAGGGPLRLELALAGSLRPRGGGAQITFTSAAGVAALRYGQLHVLDAAGRTLPARMRVNRKQLDIVINDRGAPYPLRVDPFVQQGSKLTASDETGKGQFGTSVALSADGNTAIVGGPEDNAEVGAAWVFTRSGGNWTQQGPKLTGSGETGKARFGFAVALSGDGNTALVGGGADSLEAGAAWVFVRSGTTWEPQGAKLTGAGENGKAHFGFRVALSGGEGNTALIGGPLDATGMGAAWVFVRSGTTWEPQGAKLTGGGESGKGEFGEGVALSGDGGTALIGGGGDNSEAGAAWVFVRSGSTWQPQGSKLTGAGEVGLGHFGFRVALSEDGGTALIGGGGDNNEAGAAWVFTSSAGNWTPQGPKLIGSGESGKGHFGYAVALSGGAGNTALIGAVADNNEAGAAWAFTRSGATWEQQGVKLTGAGESGRARFGDSVALSADASTALIGGGADASELGAAWAFTHELAPPPIVITGAATSLTQESAVLNATVNPSGSSVSDCHFEYGTGPKYGSSAPCSSAPGSGSAPVAVSAQIENLSPHQTYHFQIVATNEGGTSSGSDQTFTTGEAPEFGRCAKVTGQREGSKIVYHGGFTASTCLVRSRSRTGKYEWTRGAVKAGFTSKLKEGVLTLETVRKGKLTCTSATMSGQYAGTREVVGVVVKLSGCESRGKKCTTTGLLEGEMETKTLEGTLGWEAKAKKKVALDLFPAGKSGPYMEYRCGEPENPLVTLEGSLLAPVTADTMVVSSVLAYAQSAGKQKPDHFEGLPRDVLTATHGATSEQIGQAASTVLTDEEALEINAVV